VLCGVCNFLLTFFFVSYSFLMSPEEVCAAAMGLTVALLQSG
jgi:hypothetical protein